MSIQETDKNTYDRYVFRRWARLDAIGGTRGVATFVSFFFIPPSGSFSLSLPLLFRYSYSLIFILIWALASGVGSFLVLLPFLNLWEAFFFPLPVLDYT